MATGNGRYPVFYTEGRSRLFQNAVPYSVTASPTRKKQGIAVGIHFIGIPDDGHQSINTFSHVGVPRDQVKFRHTGQIA